MLFRSVKGLAYLDIFPEKLPDGDNVYLLDLTDVPVCNRNRADNSTDASTLCYAYHAYNVLQAYQKVFNYYVNQQEIKKPSTEWLDRFGETGVEWLKSIGVHEQNGYSPVNTFGYVTDFYLAPTLEVKVKGFVSLPSVQDVIKRIEAGKQLSGGAAVMAKALDIYKQIMLKPEPHLVLLDMQRQVVAQKRNVENELAGFVFAALISQKNIVGFDKSAERKLGNTLYLTGKLLSSQQKYNLTLLLQSTKKGFVIVSMRVS